MTKKKAEVRIMVLDRGEYLRNARRNTYLKQINSTSYFGERRRTLKVIRSIN